MINNGRLKNRIDILEPIKTTNKLGQDAVVYRNKKTVWCEIRPLRGKEYLEAVALNAKTTYKITMRYTEDITEKNYLRYKNKIFNIDSIIDVENRHRELEIMCNEYVGKDIKINGENI